MKAIQFSEVLGRCRISHRASVQRSTRLALCRSRRSHSTVCVFGSRAPKLVCSTATGSKLISKAEVPAHIPREDLISEMFRWANIDAGANGFERFGMEMIVEPYLREEGVPGGEDEGEGEAEKIMWGFDVGIMSGGKEVHRIGIRMDLEEVTKHEFVGYGKEGFPEPQGRATDVKGKCFEIWKMDENKVEPEARQSIKALCEGFALAVSGYYSFGSCFTEDSL